ncbi:MAG: inositol monophosphatase family protein [Bacteroidales bacterium]|jgi:myo-inositol-1(or 4)-monophosphatase
MNKSNFNWAEEAEVSLKAVSSAAEIIENNSKDLINIKSKESFRDIVTELDIAIEHFLIKELLKTSYEIIGEETFDNKTLNLSNNNPTWYIDPIDGTTNFISSIPFFGISVGLGINLDFEVGTVIFPALKEIFFTSNNGISYLNGKPLKSKPRELKNSLLSMAFSGSTQNVEYKKKQYEIFGKFNDNSRGCLRTGSAAANICYAASGRFGAVIGFTNKIWDIAGGIAIAKNAGCEIYIEQVDNANSFNYVVGAKCVSEQIVEIITKNNLSNLIKV